MIRRIKWIAMIAAVALCVGMIGCGKKETSESEDTPSAETSAEAEKEDEQLDINPQAREAYAAALNAIFSQNIWPDGKEIDGEYTSYHAGDLSENKFAVCDVDNDGEDELILHVTTATMAGMFESIYAYDADTGSVVEKFTEFPDITYYDNGILKANWSHNQGYGMELWPFSLYQYDKTSDTYLYKGSVDSWEKEVYSDGFPSAYDTDGDGIVYLLSEEANDTSGTSKTVDGDAYQQWVNSYLDGAEEIEINWLSLESQNINAILQ